MLRLKKALYDLKRAPRAWNRRIDKYFQEEGFSKSPCENVLYSKGNIDGDSLIVCLCVDDLIFIGSNTKMFKSFKVEMG